MTGRNTRPRDAAWSGPSAVARMVAAAIVRPCVLCFDPETGWGHWSVARPGAAPVVLGFVRVQACLRDATLPSRALVVRRESPGSGFRVMPADPDRPQWSAWMVLRAWER